MAAVLALAACGGGDEESCPPVPTCVSGLSVSVATPPAQAYRIEVLQPGQTTPQVKDCSGGPCTEFFHGLVAPQVTISVVLASSGAVVTSTSVSPVYNGLFSTNRCGVVDCRTAFVTV